MSNMGVTQQYLQKQREEQIRRIAEAKAQKALKNGTKLEGLTIGPDGTDILQPTLTDRLQLTGPGAAINNILTRLGVDPKSHPYSSAVDLDARNEMAEVKKQADAIIARRTDINEAQKLLDAKDSEGNSYLDLYPGLRGLKAEDGTAAIRQVIDAKNNENEIQEIFRSTNTNPELVGLKRGSPELQDPDAVSDAVTLYLRNKEQKDNEFNKGIQQGTLDVNRTNANNQTVSLRNQVELEKARLAREEIIRKNELEYRQYEAQENRKMQKSRDDMTMQLAILDRTDRREERNMNREDRKEEDRQAAIMALITGLTRLGQNFQL